MEIFTAPEKNYGYAADKYKRSGETARVSLPIELEGKLYREIVYNKTFMGKLNRNLQGIVFVTEEGEYVSDHRLSEKLAELGYYFEVMLSTTNLNDLKNAVAPEKELMKEEVTYHQVIMAAENLKHDSGSGIEVVVDVFSKLVDIKKANNKALEDFINKAESMPLENFAFSSAVYDELYQYYREILIQNFARVKLVNKGRNYYDALKKSAVRAKRGFTYRFNQKDIVQGIIKTQYEIDRLKKLLMVYDAVVDMRQDEYLRYLKSIEKKNISERIKLIR